MATASLIFYFAPGTSSMAAHIGLHEVGAQFEGRAIALSRKETHTEAFLALNPQGTVPLLLIEGGPLTEVAAILFYLARRFPEARLLPSEPEAEARVVSWMSFVASALHPTISGFNRATQEAARQAVTERSRRVFKLADARLGAGPFAVGEYSIADIHLFRLYFRYRHTFSDGPSELPNLEAHYQRMLARPAVHKTLEIESAIGYDLRNFTPPVLPAK
jgi:glutathione S-transferase